MSLERLAREWDVVVIGAGVAGSVSAYRLACRGLSVLLVEKSLWPRDKPCGGCISAAALQALDDAGLGEVGHAGPPFSRLRLASGRHQALVGLPSGRAISRRLLDARLAERAEAAGVTFLTMTHARLEPVGSDAQGRGGVRRIALRQADKRFTVAARLVIGGDGLGSRLLHEDDAAALRVATNSRIGMGATVDDAPGFYEQGTIHMACGRHGYVGLVRVEEGRLNLGAALDPNWVKRSGGPLAAVTAILDENAFPPIDALSAAQWQGTPHLTRRRSRLGAERVLILGDAAGYVEPFTGEGMGWAVAGAAAIEPLALQAVQAWRGELVDEWTARHAEVIRARQRSCRVISALLRRPWLVAAMLPLANAAPGMVAPFTSWLNRRYALDPREGR
ncbi:MULTISPECIES: NAD(P)/FAD-dependent oxidoreductase [Halomonadaceae]|uniref:NAD(P)/FAD-dependent oxidoreductase n=1 Tax=Halomonadaceae TaxID=28256 RepID=UPI00159840B9|nr:MULTISPECIES: FAD-dependent oxidoreductase [Halomonas]QJQ94544.1 FAD-dependent oxidoreductase [Halomonas sp. PA5]